MTRRLPRSTLFPYTTLFRSLRRRLRQHHHQERDQQPPRLALLLRPAREPDRRLPERDSAGRPGEDSVRRLDRRRSEEHTSELQSQSNLVCRLLLEKKKNTQL